MLITILLLVAIVGAIVQFFKTHVLQIKEPTHAELWEQLESTTWFQDLVADETNKTLVYELKETELLSDAYYVEKLIKHEGTRLGFVRYLNERKEKEFVS